MKPDENNNNKKKKIQNHQTSWLLKNLEWQVEQEI